VVNIIRHNEVDAEFDEYEEVGSVIDRWIIKICTIPGCLITASLMIVVYGAVEVIKVPWQLYKVVRSVARK